MPDLRACLHDAPDVYGVAGRVIANDAGWQATVVMHSRAGPLAPCIWGADNRLTTKIGPSGLDRETYFAAGLWWFNRSCATLDLIDTSRRSKAMVAGLCARRPRPVFLKAFWTRPYTDDRRSG